MQNFLLNAEDIHSHTIFYILHLSLYTFDFKYILNWNYFMNAKYLLLW